MSFAFAETFSPMRAITWRSHLAGDNRRLMPMEWLLRLEEVAGLTMV